MNGCRISAVIFDLDGTLLNTEQLTKDILKEFLVKYGKVVDMEKENKRLGMMHQESAMAIVKDYDLPITPQQYSQSIGPMYHEKWLQAKALPGVNRLIKHLHKHGVPYALASNSIKKNVEFKVFSQKGWKEYFSVILGSDEVKSGKPSPDLFLEAANRMGVDASCCLVIEDSLVGIKAGKAANMQVVAVPSIQSESDQYSIADHVIHTFLDFQPELWALPPFEDWVMKALPIEPIHFKGSYKNGFLQESSGLQFTLRSYTRNFNHMIVLESPIMELLSSPVKSGVSILVGLKLVRRRYLRLWLASDGTVPVALSGETLIELWHPYRNIHENEDKDCSPLFQEACFMNGGDGEMGDEVVEVRLVGYIRGFHTKKNVSTEVQILNQDKSIAEACLDLAAYSYDHA